MENIDLSNKTAIVTSSTGGIGFAIAQALLEAGATVAHLQPQSHGTLRLASDDPRVRPLIDFAYLRHPDDLPALVTGVRHAMAIAAQPTLSPYTSKQNFDPKAPDDALAKMILATAGTVYHSVGTAPIGADGDPATVLDPQLRVRRVEGLRGIDASAMPETIRGHTMAPTLYVAERGCELIRGKTL